MRHRVKQTRSDPSVSRRSDLPPFSSLELKKIRAARVRLIDNSSDLGTDPDSGPTTLYDSALDPEWPNPHTDCGTGAHRRGINEPGWVDAKGFVNGELVQGPDGRVRRKSDALRNGGEGNKGRL